MLAATGELELDTNNIDTKTLRTMQQYVARCLGKSAPVPAAARQVLNGSKPAAASVAPAPARQPAPVAPAPQVSYEEDEDDDVPPPPPGF